MSVEIYKLLIVDDDAFIRLPLEAMLTGAGYEVEMAVDGEDAWGILDSEKYNFSAVLLDRNMPRLDGMGLLARMKADKRFMDLPVIFQTASKTPREISEGIKAGAFYYLVKPVDEDVLYAIVQSAVSKYTLSGKQNIEQNQEQANLSRVLGRCEFKLQTMLEARLLATVFSGFYPQPQRTFLGLLELLINAVEHGNLAITYQEKTRLLQVNQWETEITRRLHMPKYADKRVKVVLENNSRELSLTIIDEGDGFDSSQYMDISPERAFDPNGRGIAMSRMMSFDSLEYKGKGNELVAVVKI